VTAYTQTCPQSTPDGGPYSAPSYAALHTGTVTFGSAATQTVTSTGDPTTSSAFDPIAGTSDACKTITPQSAPGTAVYTYASNGFTLLGLPTVTATINTTGSYGELNSQLFDVAPDGTERLISRGAYRLTDNQAGPVTFQLHGNGYHFDSGHTAKLVLLGSDSPYLRKSNNSAFTVAVSDLTVTLPTA
jgi:predicted acyl esterase